MSITSSVASKNYEYVLKLKEKLSPNKKQDIIDSIKSSSLFFRAYENDGNTWYELRSSENLNHEESPDATLLIESDFVYIMRKEKSVPLWQGLESFQHCIEDDLEFMTEGAFYSCIPPTNK